MKSYLAIKSYPPGMFGLTKVLTKVCHLESFVFSASAQSFSMMFSVISDKNYEDNYL